MIFEADGTINQRELNDLEFKTKESIMEATNYRLLTGVFAGEVVEEAREILDIPFCELDLDMQFRIKSHKGMEPTEEFESAQEEEWGKQSYESSWESEETDQPVTLTPASEW